MNHPASDDYTVTVNEAIDFVSRMESALIETQTLMDNGMASDSMIRGLPILQERHQFASDRSRILERWDFRYGYVFASSGFRISSSQCSLDWALIERREKSINTVSRSSSFFIKKKWVSDFKLSWTHTTGRPSGIPWNRSRLQSKVTRSSNSADLPA